MRFERKVGVKGIVNVQVLNDDDSIAWESGEFGNVILDQMFEKMNPNNWDSAGGAWAENVILRPELDYNVEVVIGVGDTIPSTTDTSLENEKFRTTNHESYRWFYEVPDSSTCLFKQEHVFITNKGDLDSATDGTYKELGLNNHGSADYGDPGYKPLETRTLIKDSSGNPTAISVESDQRLRVTYTISLSMSPFPETAGSFDITNIGTIGVTELSYKVQGDYSDHGSSTIVPASIYNGYDADLYIFDPDRTNWEWPALTSSELEDGYWAAHNYILEATDISINEDLENPTINFPTTTSFEITLVVPSTMANHAIGGVALGNNGIGTDPHYIALFDEADEFTKDSDYELHLTFRTEFTRT